MPRFGYVDTSKSQRLHIYRHIPIYPTWGWVSLRKPYTGVKIGASHPIQRKPSTKKYHLGYQTLSCEKPDKVPFLPFFEECQGFFLAKKHEAQAESARENIKRTSFLKGFAGRLKFFLETKNGGKKHVCPKGSWGNMQKVAL